MDVVRVQRLTLSCSDDAQGSVEVALPQVPVCLSLLQPFLSDPFHQRQDFRSNEDGKAAAANRARDEARSNQHVGYLDRYARCVQPTRGKDGRGVYDVVCRQSIVSSPAFINARVADLVCLDTCLCQTTRLPARQAHPVDQTEKGTLARARVARRRNLRRGPKYLVRCGNMVVYLSHGPLLILVSCVMAVIVCRSL